MKKVFLILIVIIETAFVADAQKTKELQVLAGMRISLTPGILLTSFNIGVGPELQAEYRFSKRVSGIVSTGCSFFLEMRLQFLIKLLRLVITDSFRLLQV